MMTKCPECGSSDIVPGLTLLTEETTSGGQTCLCQKLVEPEPAKRPFMWISQEFHAAVCDACGPHTVISKNHAEILEAHNNAMPVRSDN